MSRTYQETTTAFAEVFTANGISYQQNRSSNNNDNRLMLYFQGVKLYIPDGFHQETLSDASGNQTVMMRRFTKGADRIFLACGYTDFRKQITGLVSMVQVQLKLDPYQESYVFIFCNKKRDSIKVLRYDSNGFILATKRLLDDMKFQWPRTPDEVKEISHQQVEWLLQGLEIEQKKAHHKVKMDIRKTCF